MEYAGWTGCLGLGLMILAVAVHVFWIEEKREANAVRERTYAAETARMQMRLVDVLAEPASTGYRDHSGVQPADEFHRVLTGLLAQAAQAGVQVVQGDYKPIVEASGGLPQYRLSMPAKSSYPALCRFLSQAERVAGLRLDALQISRARIGDDQLEVQMQFSLLQEVH
jgi:hypothetical protein